MMVSTVNHVRQDGTIMMLQIVSIMMIGVDHEGEGTDWIMIVSTMNRSLKCKLGINHGGGEGIDGKNCIDHNSAD